MGEVLKRLSVWSVLLISLVALGQAPDPAVQLIYEEGKARYDAKEYATALGLFDECARREPTKARWHYNRGLALKKLKRDREAREALLESRRLEPDYKRKEIDEKLSELAPAEDAAAPDSATTTSTETKPATWVDAVIGAVCCLGIPFALVLFIAKVFFKKSLFQKNEPAAAPAPKQEPISNSRQHLDGLAGSLAEHANALSIVEHGLSLGEDAEARGHADRAATNLATARVALAAARRDERPIRDVIQALTRASEATTQAAERLVTLHGERARTARGRRAGCFFCARPLPTPQAAVGVELKQGLATTTVAACAVCARRAGTGSPPPVLMVDDEHWSKADDFDPYVNAHHWPANAKEVPAWKLAAGVPLSQVSTVAKIAGGAVLGGLAAAAVGRALDLDAAKDSDLAATAAAEAARAATRSRHTRDTDHS